MVQESLIVTSLISLHDELDLLPFVEIGIVVDDDDNLGIPLIVGDLRVPSITKVIYRTLIFRPDLRC